MQMIRTEQQWFNLRRWWTTNKHACCHHSIANRIHHAYLDHDTCPSLQYDLKIYVYIFHHYQANHKQYEQTQDQKIIAQVLSRVTGFARCLCQNGSIQSNDNATSSLTDCPETLWLICSILARTTLVLLSHSATVLLGSALAEGGPLENMWFFIENMWSTKIAYIFPSCELQKTTTSLYNTPYLLT